MSHIIKVPIPSILQKSHEDNYQDENIDPSNKKISEISKRHLRLQSEREHLHRYASGHPRERPLIFKVIAHIGHNEELLNQLNKELSISPHISRKSWKRLETILSQTTPLGITPKKEFLSILEKPKTFFHIPLKSGTPSQKMINLICLQSIGIGTFNQVFLAWNIKTQTFVALRTARNPHQHNQLLRDGTKQSQILYNEITSLFPKEASLVEDPGELLFDPSEGVYYAQKTISLQGDLATNQSLMSTRIPKCSYYLLEQLSLFLKSGCALGDIKPENVLLYEHEGQFVPKISDWDKGISISSLTDHQKRLLSLLPHHHDETTILRTLYQLLNESSSHSLSPQEYASYENFQKQFKKMCLSFAISSYSFDDFSTAKAWILNNHARALEILIDPTSTDSLEERFHLISCFLVNQLQQIDIRGVGITLLLTALGNNEINRDLIRSITRKSLNKEPYLEDIFLIRTALIQQQETLPLLNRLPNQIIDTIIKMVCNEIEPTESGKQDLEEALFILGKITQQALEDPAITPLPSQTGLADIDERYPQITQYLLNHPEKKPAWSVFFTHFNQHQLILSEEEERLLITNCEHIETFSIIFKTAHEKKISLEGTLKAIFSFRTTQWSYSTHLPSSLKSLLVPIKLLGKGSFNAVYMFWDLDNQKFIALRKPLHPEKKDDFIETTKKSLSLYQTLMRDDDDDEELLETPDLLVLAPNGQPASIRELATLGDLKKQKKLFHMNFKTMTTALIKQLIAFKESGIALGDIKPENINVYMSLHNRPLPKISDVDHYLSRDFIYSKLITLWDQCEDIMKKEEWTREQINDFMRHSSDREGLSQYPQTIVKAFKNFQYAIVDLAQVELSPDYSLGEGEASVITFYKQTSKFITQKLTTISQENIKDSLYSFAQDLVERVQTLDTKALGSTLCSLLVEEGTSTALYTLRQNFLKGEIDETTSIEFLRALQEEQQKIPFEERLTENQLSHLLFMIQSGNNLEAFASELYL